MTTFDQRLAELADRAQPLDADLARALIQLAADVDRHLEQHRAAHNTRATDLFSKWNDFQNESMLSAFRANEERMASERRRLARLIAGDPRWQGGYAAALALLEAKETSES